MSNNGVVFSLPQRENNDDDWDRYSENIRPTRRGRKIDALRIKPEEVVTEAVAREKLDHLLQNLDNVPDEISKILEFCSWFEEKMAIGSQKLYYELLWRIISRNGFIQKYLEDERMLKIWEKLADNSAGHAHDIYQFAISRKSLIRCAALYARWSQCVELAGAVVEARRVLILAKTNQAIPIGIINNAEDDLEMREMRRHMEQRDSDSDDDEESRKAFTNLQVIGDAHAVPIVRLPSISADSTQKPMRFDDGNTQKIGIAGTLNEMQPFEVLPYADADDIEYLKSVHELNAHIERYAIKETTNPQITDGASTSEPTTIFPTSSSGFEVWTIDAPTRPGEPSKPKARMAIKKIFKDMSFEEYAAQLPNHPSMAHHVVKKLNFDDTL